MVYKYLNSEKIDSDNCADWEHHFRVCMQQPRSDARAFIAINGEVVLNALVLRTIEANTDWNIVRRKTTAFSNKTPLVHLSGIARPNENGEQIFLVKDKRCEPDNSWLHYAPNHVIEGIAILVFDSYERTIEYAHSRSIECSIWQLSGEKFELLHDFGYK